jgi:pimeloyl-ACP methyl ester carboxylesterase
MLQCIVALLVITLTSTETPMRKLTTNRLGRALSILAMLSVVAACQSIEVKKASLATRAAEARRTVLDGDDVGTFTREILHRRAIWDYRADPIAAIHVLDTELRETHDRKLAAAIAELGYLQKRRWTNVDFQALATTIRYSYAFLFDPRLEPVPSPFDARYRGMCDLYNTAVADWVRARRALPPAQRSEIKLDWYVGSSIAHVTRNDFAWTGEEFQSALIAGDYEVEGLVPPAMRRGIGVPCLVKRSWNRKAELAGGLDQRYRYLPKTVAFPMTLVVRWPDDCSILDPDQPDASIETIDPMAAVSVIIADRTVPIEVDYTTPVAVMVSSLKPPSGIDALIHTGDFAKRSGLIMFQPYRPDRITVLFVHGLASGPETWLPLFNRLLADEAIRTRFQFAFWFYPTGATSLESAANLRRALEEAHHALGPESNFRERGVGVICAHSLGGVISSTLVTDSGDKLWNTVFTVPPAELPVDDAVRQDIVDRFEFEHLPYVKRIIYYATPHRGAPEASTGLMQWASGLIRLPKELFDRDQAKLNKYVRKDVRSKHYTVAQSLSAHNPVFEALADLPVAPGVIYHSIIGDKDQAGKKGGMDGLVPYWSSHLDGAASEVIYKSGHSVQQTPQAARETRRILLEHLRAVDSE